MLAVPRSPGFDKLCEHLLDDKSKINLKRFEKGLDYDEAKILAKRQYLIQQGQQEALQQTSIDFSGLDRDMHSKIAKQKGALRVDHFHQKSLIANKFREPTEAERVEDIIYELV